MAKALAAPTVRLKLDEAGEVIDGVVAVKVAVKAPTVPVKVRPEKVAIPATAATEALVRTPVPEVMAAVTV